jgi:hypothetical protein
MPARGPAAEVLVLAARLREIGGWLGFLGFVGFVGFNA